MSANRATRRSMGKRAAVREAYGHMDRIIELRAKGHSAATIAAGLPVSQRCVERVLAILEGEPGGRG